MTSKTLSVTEDVYNLLTKMQLPGESYADTIRRLCKSRSSFGLRLLVSAQKGWTDFSNEEVDSLENTLEYIRKSIEAEKVDVK